MIAMMPLPARSFVGVASSFVALAIVAGCGRFGSDGAGSDALGDAAPEAATTTGDAALGSDSNDAAKGCRVLIDDSFTTGANGAWNLLGQARAVDDELELIPNEIQASGAAWLNVAGDGTGVLRATFTTKMVESGADGLTFAWSAKSDPTIGGGGGDLGICEGGLDALAIAFRDLNGRVELLDTSNCFVQGDLNPTALAGTHQVSVTVRPEKIDVDFGGTSFTFSPTRAFPVKAIGFTAGSGSSKGRHAIDDVHVELCPE